MEREMPEWYNAPDVADTLVRARLVVIEANEMRLAAGECRRRAAVLRGEAQRLREAARDT